MNEFESYELADAVAIEPVSTPKFPANREKNREFFNFGGSPRIRPPLSPMISGLLSRIPYASEQGISKQEQGNFEAEQGICAALSLQANIQSVHKPRQRHQRESRQLKNNSDGGEAILEAFRSLNIDYVFSTPGSEWPSF